MEEPRDSMPTDKQQNSNSPSSLSVSSGTPSCDSTRETSPASSTGHHKASTMTSSSSQPGKNKQPIAGAVDMQLARKALPEFQPPPGKRAGLVGGEGVMMESPASLQGGRAGSTKSRHQARHATGWVGMQPHKNGEYKNIPLTRTPGSAPDQWHKMPVVGGSGHTGRTLGNLHTPQPQATLQPGPGYWQSIAAVGHSQSAPLGSYGYNNGGLSGPGSGTGNFPGCQSTQGGSSCNTQGHQSGHDENQSVSVDADRRSDDVPISGSAAGHQGPQDVFAAGDSANQQGEACGSSGGAVGEDSLPKMPSSQDITETGNVHITHHDHQIQNPQPARDFPRHQGTIHANNGFGPQGSFQPQGARNALDSPRSCCQDIHSHQNTLAHGARQGTCSPSTDATAGSLDSVPGLRGHKTKMHGQTQQHGHSGTQSISNSAHGRSRRSDTTPATGLLHQAHDDLQDMHKDFLLPNQTFKAGDGGSTGCPPHGPTTPAESHLCKGLHNKPPTQLSKAGASNSLGSHSGGAHSSLELPDAFADAPGAAHRLHEDSRHESLHISEWTSGHSPRADLHDPSMGHAGGSIKVEDHPVQVHRAGQPPRMSCTVGAGSAGSAPHRLHNPSSSSSPLSVGHDAARVDMVGQPPGMDHDLVDCVVGQPPRMGHFHFHHPGAGSNTFPHLCPDFSTPSASSASSVLANNAFLPDDSNSNLPRHHFTTTAHDSNTHRPHPSASTPGLSFPASSVFGGKAHSFLPDSNSSSASHFTCSKANLNFDTNTNQVLTSCPKEPLAQPQALSTATGSSTTSTNTMFPPQGIVITEGDINSARCYCYDRGDGTYTRLIPLDVLPFTLSNMPARENSDRGMIILPVPSHAGQVGQSADSQLIAVTGNNGTGTPAVSPTDPVQSRIDNIVAAAPAAGPLVLRRSVASSRGLAPVLPRKAKEYCDKWIHDGTCAFTQQGCKFKHEMPLDKDTQMGLGLFHGLPNWYKKLQAEQVSYNDDRPIPMGGSQVGYSGSRFGNAGGAFGVGAGAAGRAQSWRRVDSPARAAAVHANEDVPALSAFARGGLRGGSYGGTRGGRVAQFRPANTNYGPIAPPSQSATGVLATGFTPVRQRSNTTARQTPPCLGAGLMTNRYNALENLASGSNTSNSEKDKSSDLTEDDES